MDSGALKALDFALYRRGQLITALARWLSAGLALLCLAFVWDGPRTLPWAALGTAAGYLALNAAFLVWGRRIRALKLVQDAVDALAVGLGASFTGGLDSPIWLLLYAHAVGVAARRGLAAALAFGALDAGIVAALAAQSQAPLGTLHALSLLFCAFLAGTTSSYLQQVQDRLALLNRELKDTNAQLEDTLAARNEIQREQEQSLSRLSESEDRYRRLLERIQDGVIIVQDGRLAYASEVFGKMVGEAPPALVGLDFRDLVPPEDRRELSERYRAWEQSLAVSGSLETRVRTRHGDTLLVQVRAASLEFQGRRSVIATLRDVTRERRMEQEIVAHAERLTAVNEIANAVNENLTPEDIVAVVADEARRLVPFDRLTVALLDREEPEARPVRLAVGAGSQRLDFPAREAGWAFREPVTWCEGDPTPCPPRAAELLAQEGVLSLLTVPLRAKGGLVGSLNLCRQKAVPFSATALAVMETVARHLAIALENARLLQAVQSRSRELESLLEIAGGISVRLDLAELLPLVTRSVNRVMGTQHCLLVLRDGEELKLAAQEGLEDEIVAAFRDGHPRELEDSLTGWILREGRPLAVADMIEDPRLRFGELVRRFSYRSFLGVPLRRGDEVLGSLEVVTKEPRRFGEEDQTLMTLFAGQAAIAIENARLFEEARAHLAQVVEANRRLEELDRLRREYVRNVSHEFRTPLTVIRGYAEFLQEAHESVSVPDILRVVVESCDRLIDLVETLIDVSRIEQGESERILHVQSLDLGEVAAASVESLRAPAARKGVQVDLELADGELSLEGDASLLRQVVRKLLDNAVKYSRAGGRVVLRGRPQDQELELVVEDEGIGIPPEHQPRIFEKFYMVDGGIARRLGGTGVGLYLVREIVRLHGGTVTVDSRPGEGSAFSVRLPRRYRGAAARPRAIHA
jgi:PAS domain S-box-containing protein